jgi:hypothetical protein
LSGANSVGELEAFVQYQRRLIGVQRMFMKTILSAASLWVLVGLPISAQNITLTGALTYTTPAPVVQAAPVVYQPAPVYSTPVVAVPAVVAAPLVCPPPYISPVVYRCGPSPDVIYFGGPYSHVRNYYSGYRSGPYNGCSSVVYFGRGESFERGYCFNRFR